MPKRSIARRSTRSLVGMVSAAVVCSLGLALLGPGAAQAAEGDGTSTGAPAGDAAAAAAPAAAAPGSDTAPTDAAPGGEPPTGPAAAPGAPDGATDAGQEPAPASVEPDPASTDSALEPTDPAPAPDPALEPAHPAVPTTEQAPVLQPTDGTATEPATTAPEALSTSAEPAPTDALVATTATEPVAAVAPVPELSCTAATFYALTSAGSVRAVTDVPGTNNATTVAIGAWSVPTPRADALAVAPAGAAMLALDVTDDGVEHVLSYTADGGWQAVVSGFRHSNSEPLVAGAVNLANGQYYVGGYDVVAGTVHFRLYRVDVATGALTAVGHFPTQVVPRTLGSGDIGFDAAGNLYVLHGNNFGIVYTVTASALANPGPTGQLAVSASVERSFNGLQEGNGIAFDSSGAFYISDSKRVFRFESGAWSTQDNQVGGLDDDGVTTDLASCNTPATLTIRKDVVGRIYPSDQFALRTVDTAAGAVGSATTAGEATGVQSIQIGPIPVLTGSAHSFSEAMAPGSTSAIGDYASAYSCSGSAGAGASGIGTSGSVTMPSTPGVSVVCTFRNAPLIGAVTTVGITKLIEAADGTRAPASGWEVGAAISGTVTTPAGQPQTQLTDAQGAASWLVNHSTTSSTATIAVSETQQAGYGFVTGWCAVTSLAGAQSTVPLTADGATLQSIGPGSSVDCTFVNAELPTTLTLLATVAGSEPAASWQLSATRQAAGLDGPTGVSGVSGTISPAVPYLLGQSGGPDTYVQDGAWGCVSDGGASVAVVDGVVTASAGAAVTCTVTSATATLTLLKHIDGSAPTTITAADFTLTATPLADPALDLATCSAAGSETVAAANTFEVRPGHGYLLAETSQLAYLGLRLQHYEGGLPADGVLLESGWRDVVDATAAIELEPRERAVYRFVNSPVPALALPLTGGLGADAYLAGGTGLLALAALLLLAQARLRSHRLHGRLS